MKYVILLCSALLILGFSACKQTPAKAKIAAAQPELQTVEASCGTCNFGLKGKTCALAVKINGKAYFVDGTDIDDHGDAHADNGFCEAVRKAEVKGTLVNGRFKATYFKLLPAKAE
ncbi:MAG: DUF6370 family protein [Sphingobacteriaceae bacterium]